MGRPCLYTPEMGALIVELTGKGCTLAKIAEICGVSERVVSNYLKDDQDLMRSVRKARYERDRLVEDALFARATGYTHPEQKTFQTRNGLESITVTKHYPPDTAAAVFWLKNRASHDWRDRVEVASLPVPEDQKPVVDIPSNGRDVAVLPGDTLDTAEILSETAPIDAPDFVPGTSGDEDNG